MASPALTGTPTAPTPSATSSDTTIATTAFVKALLASYAALSGATFTGPVKVTDVTITPSGTTYTMDCNAGNEFTMGTLSANVTLANVMNPPPTGKVHPFFIRFRQDATGGRTITFGNLWVNMGGTTYNTSANKWNAIAGRVFPDGTVFYSIVKGA